jgi:hypothetical protein
VKNQDQTFEALLVSTAVAASLLGIAPKTLRNWLSSKDCPVPRVKSGRRKMFRVKDLVEYVDCLEPDIPSPAPVVPLECSKRGPGRPRNTERRPA